MAATFLPYRPPANPAHNRIATVVASTAALIAFLALWAATQRAAAMLAPGQTLTGRVVGTGRGARAFGSAFGRSWSAACDLFLCKNVWSEGEHAPAVCLALDEETQA